MKWLKFFLNFIYFCSLVIYLIVGFIEFGKIEQVIYIYESLIVKLYTIEFNNFLVVLCNYALPVKPGIYDYCVVISDFIVKLLNWFIYCFVKVVVLTAILIYKIFCIDIEYILKFLDSILKKIKW